MQEVTSYGSRRVSEIAARHGVSPDATLTLLQAVANGGGAMAQFSHPELGGMGQWSRGGMIMVGDMFNHRLKARVDALCNELSSLLREPDVLAAPDPKSAWGGSAGNWWPDGLGSPASSGSQNDSRYAWFPAARRLAVQQGGRVSLYDTGDHRIGGASQQQGGGQSLSFTSQFGTVRTIDLPLVQGPGNPPELAAAPTAVAPDGDVFATIEKLAGLRQKGLLTEEEFSAKKAELLSRL